MAGEPETTSGTTPTGCAPHTKWRRCDCIQCRCTHVSCQGNPSCTYRNSSPAHSGTVHGTTVQVKGTKCTRMLRTNVGAHIFPARGNPMEKHSYPTLKIQPSGATGPPVCDASCQTTSAVYAAMLHAYQEPPALIQLQPNPGSTTTYIVYAGR